MLVEVFSDVVCPWCWLGKRRLERARTQVDFADDVQIRWRAFQLDPSAPVTPQSYGDVLARKYGSREAVAGMTRRLEDLGREEGLDYRWDLIQRVNSFDAHRLLAWTATHGLDAQDALVERLFLAYFSEGANVADHAQLAALAGETGLDIDDAQAVLVGSEYGDEVRADRERAIDLEVLGVPAFVFAPGFAVPGAQDVDTFRLLLVRAHDRLVS